MANITFKIWDNEAKEFVYDDTTGFHCCYPTIDLAEKAKDYLLQRGDYPDKPHTVFSIYKYERSKFIEII